MKKNKLYLCILLLILAACAPGSTAAPTEAPIEAATEAPAEATVELPTAESITFWSWAEYDFEAQALQNMVDAYNSANPDSQVELSVKR
jgi:ABC-type glycerol-3-phosphate transport system substrate-binding protein